MNNIFLCRACREPMIKVRISGGSGVFAWLAELPMDAYYCDVNICARYGDLTVGGILLAKPEEPEQDEAATDPKEGLA
jgi:hypothetical protein